MSLHDTCATRPRLPALLAALQLGGTGQTIDTQLAADILSMAGHVLAGEVDEANAYFTAVCFHRDTTMQEAAEIRLFVSQQVEYAKRVKDADTAQGSGPLAAKTLGTLLAALLLGSGLLGCSGDTWTRTDTVMESLVGVALAADAYQTAQFQHHEDQYEAGLARGACGYKPSNSCSAIYFGTVAISHVLIARALPASLRPYWQSGFVAAEVPTVINNKRITR